MGTPGDTAVDLKIRIETCAQMLVRDIDAAESAKLLDLGDGARRAAERLAVLWKESKAASVVVTWVDDPTGRVVFKVKVQLGGGGPDGVASPGAKVQPPQPCAACGGVEQHTADCPTDSAKRSP